MGTIQSRKGILNCFENYCPVVYIRTEELEQKVNEKHNFDSLIHEMWRTKNAVFARAKREDIREVTKAKQEIWYKCEEIDRYMGSGTWKIIKTIL